MRLGDLTTDHIGRTITVAPGAPARVVDSVRHFRINPAGSKEKVSKTSVMLGSTGAKGADHLGEHIGDSTDRIVIGNG